MSNSDKMPENLIVEFLRANGNEIRLIDLGAKFLSDYEIDKSKFHDYFRIGIAKQISKAGNAYYDYSQNGVPFPDGLSTSVRVQDLIIPLSEIRPSKKGYPTREGTAKIIVGNMIYNVTVYITESRQPYYIKIIAKKDSNGKPGVQKSKTVLKGGSII